MSCMPSFALNRLNQGKARLNPSLFPAKLAIPIRLESKSVLRIQFNGIDTQLTGAWTDSQIASPTCHENQGRFCHDPI